MYNLSYELQFAVNHNYVLFVVLVISHLGFKGGNLVLIASVPGHCLHFTFKTSLIFQTRFPDAVSS